MTATPEGATRSALDSLSERRTGTVTNHEDVWSNMGEDWTWTVAELAAEMVLSPATVRRYLEDLRSVGLADQVNLTRPAKYIRRTLPEGEAD